MHRYRFSNPNRAAPPEDLRVCGPGRRVVSGVYEAHERLAQKHLARMAEHSLEGGIYACEVAVEVGHTEEVKREGEKALERLPRIGVARAADALLRSLLGGGRRQARISRGTATGTPKGCPSLPPVGLRDS
jgi:hypothetical protein